VSNWPTLDIPKWHQELPELDLRLTSGQLPKLGKNEIFKMYVCGITPYDATHLGHAATYLTFDLIHRYLMMSGREVDFVENITDIDDPLFERAKRDNQSWSELGETQVALFESDMTSLRILPPKNYVAVTEAMSSIIGAIEFLVEKGLTYELSGNIYFRM
jgi:L-cysteine:1D-myo-inositol 2-amino-2-deoxy-alpha-D-glucopyranoside ligase